MATTVIAPEGLEAYLAGLPFLGSLSASHVEVRAGAVEEILLVYEVGASGIADSGRLKITFKFYSDWGDLQTHEPRARDYVSARFVPRASFPGESPATLRRLAVKYDTKGHERPYQKAVIVDLVDGFARPGDRIEVRLGDRSHGGAGTRVQTFVEDAFRFRAYVDVTGTSRLAAVPGDIVLRVAAGPPHALRVLTPRAARPGVSVPVVVRLDDAWGNPCALADARVSFSLRGGAAVRETVSESATWLAGARSLRHELRPSEAGDHRLEVRVDSGEETWASSVPLSIGELPSERPYFADLHVHAHDTVGTNSTASNLSFARDLAGLDVLGYTVNDFQITDRDWSSALADIARFHADGRFVCFPGTEWCGNSAVGGDHNVVFLSDEVRFPNDATGRSLRSFEWHEHMRGAAPEPGRWPLTALYAAYQDAPERFLLIPHVGGRRASLDYHHTELERLCEVASSWGHFEWLFSEALARGYRLGASASGDEHRGRPGGGAPGASIFGVRGGLTGVLSPALDRAAIGLALRQRRTWATTGERNVALLGSGAHVQGDELEHGGPLPVRYRVLGHSGWEYVALKDHRGVVWERDLHSELGYAANRLRVRWGGARVRDRYRWANYALSLRVSGTAVEDWTARGFEHPEESVRALSDGRFEVRSTTHGDADELDLRLVSLRDARLTLDVRVSGFDGQPWGEAAQLEVHGGALLDNGRVHFDLGGEGLFVAVERVTDAVLPLELTGELTLPWSAAPPARDGRAPAYPVYLFGREIGDAKVWTSPLFVRWAR
ncbi:hypothetical protein [Sorangium sp. So ce124]|uniref:hypothetical protein n=1 Tax=Sorangium sp. So ce124 TaxID=3133280 RepID=UPI003F5EDEFB